VLFEALDHLFSLDIAFFVDWFSGSIFLLFAFIAAIYFFSDGKNVLRNTIVFIITIFVWIQFQDLSGFVLIGATLLALSYMLKLVLLKFGETTPFLSNKLVLISEISFIVLMVSYNLGLIG
jgi:hypothetical protein